MKIIKSSKYMYSEDSSNMNNKEFSLDYPVLVGDRVYRRNLDSLQDYDVQNEGRVLDIVEGRYCIVSFNESDKPEVIHMDDLISADKYDAIASDEKIICDDESDSDIDKIDELESRIKEVTEDYMKKSLGWTGDEDVDWIVKDADNLFTVEVEDVHDEMWDWAYRIEVRAELGFDDMLELAESLNKIVEEYDKDAYFDMVDSGIMEAYLDRKAIINSFQTVEGYAFSKDEYYLEPPEYDDPEKVESEEIIELVLDDVLIDVYANTYDYVDQTCEFAKPPWGGDSYPIEELPVASYITITDTFGAVEYLDDLLIDSGKIPDIPGRYKLNGDAILYFDVSSYIYPNQDEIEDSSDVDIDFNEEKSIKESNITVARVR